ncbi:N1221-domain-containing protein [Eremomyces bilateralis CBS 781.70]|uniref:N1221-domain-containing protein n=1 Tax=Eremomyces bilateralis CBS 781.70 TaxID=1392243 RepID=A0A6G1FZQ3_9PEZI|nr:N1221-domain-containing protein [Eremomyces bilateralis CBS 781.70]KAF1811150.1 N1221-domain-containing protein [Eremomyces bilateralis CBS 781.70]
MSPPPGPGSNVHIAPDVPEGVDEAELILSQPIQGVDDPADSAPLDTVEQQREHQDSPAPSPLAHQDGVSLGPRPGMRRNQSVPAPHQPPPPPPPQPVERHAGNTPITTPDTSSLSLQQLRNLVAEFPKIEVTPYAFIYSDAASLPEEIEEWFSYGTEESDMLLRAETAFMHDWKEHNGSVQVNGFEYELGARNWTSSSPAKRLGFLEKIMQKLKRVEGDIEKLFGLADLDTLLYLVLGCWHETAGLQRSGDSSPSDEKRKFMGPSQTFAKSTVQIDWIKANVQMLLDVEGLQTVFEISRNALLRCCAIDPNEQSAASNEKKEELHRIARSTMTILYVSLGVIRSDDDPDEKLRKRRKLLNLQPNLLDFLVHIIDKIRWDDSLDLPLNKILILTWKSVLVTFGGLGRVEAAKRTFRNPTADDTDGRGQPLITASPLDYHLFRQEISSKYPAYNPPPPLFPLEPDNNSILPPLKASHSKFTAGVSTTTNNAGGASILHQPVHIATPAPSPPPSPAGPGGKGGKKQNYQTNQLFPFLYPPLDEMSNQLGGKGSTGLQDALVGRRWEGSDIPASILEAAELFAKRMRATRAMKQLWEERVAFMKYERGWKGLSDDDVDVEKLNLEDDGNAEAESKGPEKKVYEDGSVEERLELVERFYRDNLPCLQSLVMVLLKVILTNVTALITQVNGQNGMENGTVANGLHPDTASSSNEELDAVRSQEITAKAVSGILILLLKWFKVSRKLILLLRTIITLTRVGVDVLKAEYMTQLLVDANYIPMILKLMQTQEVERIVNYKCEREDLNFFQGCLQRSQHGGDHTQEEHDDDDSDEACPPPVIKRRREDQDHPIAHDPQHPSVQHPPEVDEMGVPTTELPAEPITNFSWRNFFSSINFLRILQKMCKNKAHRNLLLVSYKSSQFLRKSLKVPQPELRLYTLKLFKNQVPYCGRKWRQTNMRVITAVYLHCRPELRDDWLAGSDLDAEVDQSLPLEQALRALTHWHNLRRYPEKMGATEGLLEEEQDFFVRELEKMDWPEEMPDDGEAWEEGYPMNAW